ncbi:hypothetical protein B0H17DRAFT_1145852 [Mycena rosella]|uniref:Uncharacterized protein n=1 Tax=Mycena rosella TaxID=1033263 RepID=A0AAD7CSE6_MYCRO|nr:hypothetical protein B0H17DRAFT_1145852 [Mycena rosella]
MDTRAQARLEAPDPPTQHTIIANVPGNVPGEYLAHRDIDDPPLIQASSRLRASCNPPIYFSLLRSPVEAQTVDRRREKIACHNVPTPGRSPSSGRFRTCHRKIFTQPSNRHSIAGSEPHSVRTRPDYPLAPYKTRGIIHPSSVYASHVGQPHLPVRYLIEHLPRTLEVTERSTASPAPPFLAPLALAVVRAFAWHAATQPMFLRRRRYTEIRGNPAECGIDTSSSDAALNLGPPITLFTVILTSEVCTSKPIHEAGYDAGDANGYALKGIACLTVPRKCGGQELEALNDIYTKAMANQHASTRYDCARQKASGGGDEREERWDQYQPVSTIERKRDAKR